MRRSSGTILSLSIGLSIGFYIIFSCFIPTLSSGDTASYIYDDLGRLVRVVNERNECATYAFDAVGNLLSIRSHLTKYWQCAQPSLLNGWIRSSNIQPRYIRTCSLSASTTAKQQLRPSGAHSNSRSTGTLTKQILRIGLASGWIEQA